MTSDLIVVAVPAREAVREEEKDLARVDKDMNYIKTISEADRARFWAKVDKPKDTYSSDCWVWTAGKTAKGYGSFSVGGKNVRAHRFAYEMILGAPLLDSCGLDHLCRNRACVRPSHLEKVTSRTNTLRGAGIAAINAGKTHCKNGHEFTKANMVSRSSGRRECRACKRAADAVAWKLGKRKRGRNG